MVPTAEFSEPKCPLCRGWALVWVRMVWDWQSRPWCREEWRRGGAGGHRARDASASAKPFLQGSVVHSTYGGVGKGAEGESTLLQQAQQPEFPSFPPPAPTPPGASSNTSQRQSLSQGELGSIHKVVLPLSGQVCPMLRDLCTPTTVTTR